MIDAIAVLNAGARSDQVEGICIGWSLNYEGAVKLRLPRSSMAAGLVHETFDGH